MTDFLDHPRSDPEVWLMTLAAFVLVAVVVWLLKWFRGR